MRRLYDIGANRGLYADANMQKYDELILVDANAALCEGLRNKYRGNPNVKIVQALISKNKDAVFFICPQADTISTADVQWMTSSRFSNTYTWIPATNQVPVKTLDELLQEYGPASFIKIDVEGYELNVLSSLTHNPCPLNFEWADEKQEEMIQTLEHLFGLGYRRFFIQYRDDYDVEVQEDEWVSYDEVLKQVRSFNPQRKYLWGMIWAC